MDKAVIEASKLNRRTRLTSAGQGFPGNVGNAAGAVSRYPNWELARLIDLGLTIESDLAT